MKSFRRVGFVFASSLLMAVAGQGCASTTEDVGGSSEEALTSMRNVVYLDVGFGYVNTIPAPNGVIRPQRGRYLRLSVPRSCGAVQIYSLRLTGRSIDTNQVIPLAASLVAAEPGLVENRWTYEVNYGLGATAREIGLYGYFPSISGCRLNFEQGDTLDSTPTLTCPPAGYVNCQPITTNPNCAPSTRQWIEDNCPDVTFIF